MSYGKIFKVNEEPSSDKGRYVIIYVFYERILSCKGLVEKDKGIQVMIKYVTEEWPS